MTDTKPQYVKCLALLDISFTLLEKVGKPFNGQFTTVQQHTLKLFTKGMCCPYPTSCYGMYTHTLVGDINKHTSNKDVFRGVFMGKYV